MISQLIISLVIIAVAFADTTLPNQRPAYDKRTFHSGAIDTLISTIQPLFRDTNIGTLFANCLPNTLDTTVYSHTTNPSEVPQSSLDTFVITGDIDALWLRDSMNQVLPYAPYSANDKDLQYMFEGLINRHARSVLIDPFANAFNFNASGAGHQSDQRTPPMTRSVFEGKYEIDSLGAFLKLSYWYQRYNQENGALFRFADDRWLQAVDVLLTTVQTMQLDTGATSNPPYLFRRVTSEALDTLSMQGRGPPAHPNGLSRSLFRPSDDAVTLPYNIPGNAMVCVELTHLTDMLTQLNNDALRPRGKVLTTSIADLLTKAKGIQESLCGALQTYTLARHGTKAAVVPFEVDGFGGAYYMDDANIPSLLSLPVLGYMAKDHPNYQTTRDFVLSAQNPFFFQGSVAQGVGGPHVGFNFSWPMAITMRAMTSTSEEEIQSCLQVLASTTAGTGLMHESFNVNNADNFTRTWFAWANGVFGEFILQLLYTQPELLIDTDKNPDAVATIKSMVKPTVSWLAQSEPLLK